MPPRPTWYAMVRCLSSPPKGLTTKGDAMSEMLLDMEADQVTASSIEKMDNAGLSSVAEIARQSVIKKIWWHNWTTS